MGVHGEVDVVDGQSPLHGEGRLGDQVGDAGTDHLDAEDAVVRRVGDHFDHALGLSQRERPAARLEGEAADLDLDPALSRLRLPEADVGDLGVGVDAVGRGVVVGHPVGVAGDVLALFLKLAEDPAGLP